MAGARGIHFNMVVFKPTRRDASAFSNGFKPAQNPEQFDQPELYTVTQERLRQHFEAYLQQRLGKPDVRVVLPEEPYVRSPGGHLYATRNPLTLERLALPTWNDSTSIGTGTYHNDPRGVHVPDLADVTSHRNGRRDWSAYVMEPQDPQAERTVNLLSATPAAGATPATYGIFRIEKVQGGLVGPVAGATAALATAYTGGNTHQVSPSDIQRAARDIIGIPPLKPGPHLVFDPANMTSSERALLMLDAMYARFQNTRPGALKDDKYQVSRLVGIDYSKPGAEATATEWLRQTGTPSRFNQ